MTLTCDEQSSLLIQSSSRVAGALDFPARMQHLGVQACALAGNASSHRLTY